MKYKIENMCDEHIFECVALLEEQSKLFYYSGEIKSKFDIMPRESIILEYNLLPLFLGHHDLPKLHIVDRSLNHDALKLDVKRLNDHSYLNSLKDKNDKPQVIQFLVKGFTSKIFVAN